MRRSICVVIPTHNRNDLLKRTLDSLAQCDRTSAPVITYVAENGGKHGAEAVAQSAASWLNIQYRYSERPNKSHSLNQLLDEIGDDVIVFFDDDVRFSASTLVAYEQAAQQDEPGAFFGGPMGVDYESPPPRWLLPYLPASAKGLPIDDIEVYKSTPFLGCNWAAYTEHLKLCGGFNPEVGPGGTSGAVGQETDMQRRLTAAGIAAKIVPEAMVWHYVPAERCTPEWALHRAYRYGISVGTRMPLYKMQILGCPIWMLRKLLVQSAIVSVSSVFGGIESRFEARAKLHYLVGSLRGYRREWFLKNRNGLK